MKNITIKLIAIILALTAICGSVIVPVGAASADDTAITQLFEYKESGSGNITITRVEAPDEDVIIPSEIEGKTVTEFCGIMTAKSVTFPETVNDIEGTICTGEVIVDENNNDYCSVDGVLYSKDMKELIVYPVMSEASCYTIPDSVEYVLVSAFTVRPDDSAFLNSNLKKVILGKNVKVFYSIFVPFEEFEVHPENENYCSVDGVLFSKSRESLVKYPMFKPESVYSIPEGTLKIEPSAFVCCLNINELSIPETVSEISFDEEIFLNSFCYNSFRDIEVAENNKSFCSADGVLFTKDMKQLIAYNSGNERCSYIIPEGVETIQGYSFWLSVYLKSLGVPKSLKCVEANSFSFETIDYSNNKKIVGLVNIAYSGSEEEWENITIEENNEPFELANLVTNAKVEEKSNITVVYSSDNFNVDDEELANYSVRVTELEDEFSIDSSSGMYAGARYSPLGCYDIEIVDGNNFPVTIEQGEVFITMPVPEHIDLSSDFVVFHVKDNGTRIPYSLNPKNEREKQLKIEFGHFVFSVDSFSKFEFYQVIEVDSVAITKFPTKTSYLYNSGEIDLSGIELTITYTDGTTETVTDVTKMSTNGFDDTKVGTQTVTVEYEGLTADFEAEVYVKAESVAITKIPVKTSYTYKQGGIDLSGIELTVTYTDGSTETVTDTSKMTIRGFDNTKIGKQTVTVEYEGYTANFEVTVSYAWWQWIIRILLLGFFWY